MGQTLVEFVKIFGIVAAITVVLLLFYLALGYLYMKYLDDCIKRHRI